MRGSTAEPTGGIPSLTDAEIVQIYQEAFGRPPDATELSSEEENALKYSAAGIERQIFLRAGNVAGSGVRGDENLSSLTVPAPIAGNVATMGPAAFAPQVTPTGPTGTLAAPNVYGGSFTPQGQFLPQRSGGLFGLDTTTLIILVAMAGAAWYFLKK